VQIRLGVYTVSTPANIAAGLNAKEWCDHCMNVIGQGKGGGRDSQSTASIPIEGSGKSPEEVVAAVLEAAKVFAAQKGF
jgi:hypothetical protein